MPTNTYTPIASVTLSATASEVVFSGLPQTFRDYIVVATGANTEATADSSMALRINGDSGSNYSWVYAWGTGSATASGASADSRIFIGRFPGFSSVSTPASIIIQLMDATATDKQKTVLTRSNNTSGVVSMHAGRWASNSAITSIAISRYDFASGLVAGCTFTIFGVIA